MGDIEQVSRRQEYAEATRLALLDAARAVFIEDGYQQAGVDRIAKHARVTRGAFYHHFVDKRAIFEALVIELQQEAASRLVASARVDGGPFDRLSAGAREFLGICVEPAYRRLVIHDAPSVLGSRRSREIGESYPFGVLYSAMDSLSANGLISVPNARLAGRLIGTMICETAILLEDSDDPARLQSEALEIVDLALRSLGSGVTTAATG